MVTNPHSSAVTQNSRSAKVQKPNIIYKVKAKKAKTKSRCNKINTPNETIEEINPAPSVAVSELNSETGHTTEVDETIETIEEKNPAPSVAVSELNSETGHTTEVDETNELEYLRQENQALLRKNQQFRDILSIFQIQISTLQLSMTSHSLRSEITQQERAARRELIALSPWAATPTSSFLTMGEINSRYRGEGGGCTTSPGSGAASLSDYWQRQARENLERYQALQAKFDALKAIVR